MRRNDRKTIFDSPKRNCEQWLILMVSANVGVGLMVLMIRAIGS